MFHILGFSGAKTDSTADEAAPVVADQTVTRTATGNKYLAPFDATVIAAGAWNDTITRARLNYPSYRDLGLPDVYPTEGTAIPSADYAICQWGLNGPRVRKGEEFGMDSSNGASTVDIINAFAALMDSMTPIPPGRRFTVQGTAAQTLVANAWTSASIALGQTLPYGRYGVVGMHVFCAASFLARLIFPGQNQYRPGAPTGTALGINEFTQYFRYGKQGLWGTFDQTSPPQLEVLGTTGGAQTPQVWLDLVEISRGQN